MSNKSYIIKGHVIFNLIIETESVKEGADSFNIKFKIEPNYTGPKVDIPQLYIEVITRKEENSSFKAILTEDFCNVCCKLSTEKINIYEILLLDSNNNVVELIGDGKVNNTLIIEPEFIKEPFYSDYLSFDYDILKPHNFKRVFTPIEGLVEHNKYPASGQFQIKSNLSNGFYLHEPIYMLIKQCRGYYFDFFNPRFYVELKANELKEKLEDGTLCSIKINVANDNNIEYTISVIDHNIKITKKPLLLDYKSIKNIESIIRGHKNLFNLYKNTDTYKEEIRKIKSTIDYTQKYIEENNTGKFWTCTLGMARDFWWIDNKSPFYAENSIFKNECIISENPYRIIGSYSNTTSREIQTNLNKIKAFLALKKTCRFDNDRLLSERPVERSIEIVQEKMNILALPEDKAKNALFWFINKDDIDNRALESIKEKKYAKALEILKEGFNYSNFINAGLLSIAVEDWTNVILFYNKFFEEKHTKLFVSDITGNSITISIENLCDFFVDKLCENFSNVNWFFYASIIQKPKDSILYKKIIDAYYRQFRIFLDLILDNIYEEYSYTVPDLKDLKQFENKKEVNIHLSISYVIKLLSLILDEDDIRFVTTKDIIANKLFNLSIEYFNESKDKYKAMKALQIAEDSLQYAVSGKIIDKCKKNVEELKDLAINDPTPNEKFSIEKLRELEKKYSNLNILRNLSKYYEIANRCTWFLPKEKNGHPNPVRIYESTRIVEFILKNIIEVINNDLERYNRSYPTINIGLLVQHLNWAKSFIDATDKMSMEEEYRKERYEPNRNTLLELIEKYSKLKSENRNVEVRPKQQNHNDNEVKDDSKKVGCIVGTVLIVLFGLLFIIGISNNDNKKAEVQTKSNITETTTSTNTTYDNTTNTVETPEEEQYDVVNYNTGDRPYLSYYGKGKYDKRTPNCLTISNGGDADALVMLVNAKGQNIRHVFISKNDSYTMSNIPAGYYEVKILQGNDWNPERDNGENAPKGGFMKDRSISKTATYDMLSFPSPSSGGYREQSITLYKVVDGNMNTETISEDELY